MDKFCTVNVLGSIGENDIEILRGWMVEIKVCDSHCKEKRSSLSIKILWFYLFEERSFWCDRGLLECGKESTREDSNEDYYESNWDHASADGLELSLLFKAQEFGSVEHVKSSDKFF